MDKNIFYVKDKREFPEYTGVYKIGFKNSESGRVYIGSASSEKTKLRSRGGFKVRWHRHIYDLRKNKHHSSKLQRAYDKYGEDNMFFEVLEKVKKENCLIVEQDYINRIDNYNKGYNTFSVVKSDCDEQYELFIKEKYINENLETLTKLKELYQTNKSIKKLSSILNKHPCTIKYMLKFLDIYINPTYKEIYQYNLDGMLLHVWKNVAECKKSLGVTADTIRRVVKGDGIQALSYFFSYDNLSPADVVKEYTTRLSSSKQKQKKSAQKRATSDSMKRVSSFSNRQKKCIKNIIQYDSNYNIVKIWKDTTEIKQFYGKSFKSGVLCCIRGVQQTCGGFIWKIDDARQSHQY
jgi:group I intron endonuclease